MEIRFLDPARTELDEAIEYYNSVLYGLGNDFLIETLSAIKRIKTFPEAWHPFTVNTRRCQLRRFPYSVIYQIMDNEIFIVAMAHMHRKPGFWEDRIKSKN